MNQLIDLELLANRFKIHAVQEMLEAAVLTRMTMLTCSIVLSRKLSRSVSEQGSKAVWAASLAMAKSDFELFSCTRYFLSVPEVVLEEIIASEDVQASCEESIFLSVAKWMKVDQLGTLRGEDLLSCIRFPQMRPAFLNAALHHLPTSARLPLLVAEAVAMQRISSEERAKLKKQQLDPRCIHPRKQVGHKD